MEKEILEAEIYLHPINTSNATANLDEQLKQVEERIQDYAVHLSAADYAVAIASGILAGAIDVFVVGETNFFEQMNRDNLKEQAEDALERLKELFAKNQTISNPKLQKSVEPSPFVDNEILKVFSRNRTVLGMLASIALQVGKGGMIQKDPGGKVRLFPGEEDQGLFEGVSLENRVFLLIIAVIVGIMRWLIVTAEEEPLNPSDHGLIILKKLRKLIRGTPTFAQIVNKIEEWQLQAVNEIKEAQGGSHPQSLEQNTEESENKQKQIGVDQVFYSFFTMLAFSPEFNNKRLQEVMRTYHESRQVGLDQIPIINALTKQAFPVIVNEIIVRTFYFAEHLAKELDRVDDINAIDWEKVIPFKNRNIDRMMTIAAMTFNVADIVDAAWWALIESQGDLLCFGTRFLARFNFVGEGRAVVAVVREIQDERDEQALLDTRLQLQKTKTDKVMQILQQYQNELEERVSTYLAEDIETFLMGIEMMDQGLYTKDSDLVIQGNVMIQRVLGREPQFTNQEEFNDLMDSDIQLKL